MCGRYAASANPQELVETYEVVRDETAHPSAPVMTNEQHPPPGEPDFNVAPSKRVPVVLTRAPKDGAPTDKPAPVRQLRLLSWGLVPPWAKDLAVGNRMINARAESLFDKRTYAGPARQRRCLIPADGWYEWQASPTATTSAGKPRKQPFFMSRVDDSPLALAGIYEFHKLRDDPGPQDWVVSFSILTTAAEPGLDRIHHRAPVVIDPEDWARWLDPARTEDDEIRDVLRAQPTGRFDAWPVSPAVSRVSNNTPELTRSLPASQLTGVLDPATGEVIGTDAPGGNAFDH